MNFLQKYQPTKISDVVFPDPHIEEIIQGYEIGVSGQSLLLHGAWGSGKSTLAKLIPPAFEANYPTSTVVQNGYVDVMFIAGGSSARSNVGVKKIRNKTGLISINRSGKHFVILNEADLLSVPYQGALKALIDERPYAIFILTTNYIKKIDGGLRSRCDEVHLDPAPAERWMDRARFILNQEGAKISDQKLLALLKAYEGDNRKIIRALERTIVKYKVLVGVKCGSSHVGF